MFDASLSYILSVVYITAVPVAAVGFVLILAISIMACCKRRSTVDMSQNTYVVTLLIMSALSAAIISLLIIATLYSYKQAANISNVPSLINTIPTYLLQNSASFAGVATYIDACQAYVGANPPDMTHAAAFETLSTELGTIATITDTILNTLSQVAATITPIANDISPYTDLVAVAERSITMSLFVAIMCVVILHTICTITGAVVRFRPCMRPFISILTGLYTTLLSALFLVSAFFLVVSSISSDFCATPEVSLARVAYVAPADTTYYYILCGVDLFIENPDQASINTATSAINRIDAEYIALVPFLVPNAGAPSSADTVAFITNAQTATNAATCTVVNPIIEDVLQSICTTLDTRSNKIFILCIAAAACMVLLQLVAVFFPSFNPPSARAAENAFIAELAMSPTKTIQQTSSHAIVVTSTPLYRVHILYLAEPSFYDSHEYLEWRAYLSARNIALLRPQRVFSTSQAYIRTYVIPGPAPQIMVREHTYNSPRLFTPTFAKAL